MKRKILPTLSAADGFNRLFTKKKKTARIECIIDLCEEDDKENSGKDTGSSVQPTTDNSDGKVLLDSSTQEKIPDGKKEYLNDSKELMEETSMVTAFKIILKGVREDSSKSLISCEQHSDIDLIDSLSDLELDDLLRWYRRTPGWRRPLPNTFELNFEKLRKLGLIEPLTENSNISFAEMTKCLSKDEITQVAVKMMIDKKYRKTMDVLQAKLIDDYSKNTTAFFGGKSPSDRLNAAVFRQLAGNRFQLTERIRNLFNAMFVAFSPTLMCLNSAGSDSQVPGSAQINIWKGLSLGQSFLQNISRFGATDILDEKYVRKVQLILDKPDLNSLIDAALMKHRIQSLIEDKKFAEAVDIGKKAYGDFLLFQEEQKTGFELHKKLPTFLGRYTTTGNYLKVMNFLADAHEKLKQYEEANTVIRYIINQHFSPHKHGSMWRRLIINSAHLKLEGSAMADIFENGIRDKNLNEPERYEILQRMNKLLKTDSGSELKGWPTTFEEAKRVSMETDSIKDNKKWISNGSNQEMIIEGVESLALRILKKRFNFDRGLHSESAIFSSVLSLLINNQILDYSVKGSFQSVFQRGPLDFFSRDFYRSRKKELVLIFADLKEDLDDCLIKMEECWNAYPDGNLIGMTYYKNNIDGATWDEISSFCKCVGGKNLSLILKRICQVPAYRSGMPDIVAWNSNGIYGAYCLCEVKAPKDNLSFPQKCWLKFFVDKDIRCEVMHVKEVNT